MAHLRYPLRVDVAQSGYGANDRAREAPFELPPLSGLVQDHRIPTLDLRLGAPPPRLDPRLIDLLQRLARAAARTDHRDELRSTNQMR